MWPESLRQPLQSIPAQLCPPSLWLLGWRWQVRGILGQRHHMIPTCFISSPPSTELFNCQWKQRWLNSLLSKMSSCFPKVQSNIKAVIWPKKKKKCFKFWRWCTLKIILYADVKQRRDLLASVCYPSQSVWGVRQFPLEDWLPCNRSQSRQHQILARASAPSNNGHVGTFSYDSSPTWLCELIYYPAAKWEVFIFNIMQTRSHKQLKSFHEKQLFRKLEMWALLFLPNL